jgi:alkyl sulfatase BDS1-like metallo-beta-lactamase superfamily hydrolase
LAAALELRSGIPSGVAPKSTGPDLVCALSTQQFLDYLGIRLDSSKVGDASFVMNLITPDNDESFVVELSNGTLTSLQGFVAEAADLTLTINRSDLEKAMIGVVPLQQQVVDGTATLEGDPTPLLTLAEVLTQFEPTFAIMPGTTPGTAAVPADAFVYRDLGDSSGG